MSKGTTPSLLHRICFLYADGRFHRRRLIKDVLMKQLIRVSSSSIRYVFDLRECLSSGKRGRDRGKVCIHNVVDSSMPRSSQVLETITRHAVTIDEAAGKSRPIETASRRSMSARDALLMNLAQNTEKSSSLYVRYCGLMLATVNEHAKSALATCECAYWTSDP